MHHMDVHTEVCTCCSPVSREYSLLLVPGINSRLLLSAVLPSYLLSSFVHFFASRGGADGLLFRQAPLAQPSGCLPSRPRPGACFCMHVISVSALIVVE